MGPFTWRDRSGHEVVTRRSDDHYLTNGDFVELRVQLFNAFNHVNFRRPNAVYGSTIFSKIFGSKRARGIEVALKYSF